jgi:simple sugar transport system substrate-binding protein
LGLAGERLRGLLFLIPVDSTEEIRMASLSCVARRACLHVLLGLSLLPVARPALAANPPARPRIAFVSHAPDSDTWWTTIRNAIQQASEDFGVDVDYLNPHDGSIQEMGRILGGLSPQRYAGVITTLADARGLAPALHQVVGTAHLPLITINSGTGEQSKQAGAMLHIGQPEFQAGLEAGQRAAKEGVRSFVCLNHYASSAASHERCQGFAQGLGLPVSSTAELELSGSAVEMQQRIVQYQSANPQVQAWLALGPTSAHPAMAVIRSMKSGANAPRHPYFVSFDVSQDIVGGIKDGVVAFAIDQQPYAQGYLSVALMGEYLRQGAPASGMSLVKYTVYAQPRLHARMSKYGIELKPSNGRDINSGPGFVTRANVEKVERFSGQYR